MQHYAIIQYYNYSIYIQRIHPRLIEDGDFFARMLNKVLYPEKTFEISRHAIISELRLKGKPCKVAYSTYLEVSEIVLTKLLRKTDATYHQLSHDRFSNISQENYILTEDYYKYLTWFDFKTKLQFQKNLKVQPGIILYGVYWAELGRNIGSELEKLRPVLIYKKCVSKENPNLSSYIVIPITSKLTAEKYWNNYRISMDEKTCFVKTNDMQRISVKRIVKPFILKSGDPLVLSDHDIRNIKDIIKRYYVGK